MPEMRFTVRWPDGTTTDGYSPSLVLHDHLTVGGEYPVAEFAERTRAALDEASERVRARFGFACTAAIEQRDEIAATARGFAGGTVRVLVMEPPLPADAGVTA